MPSKMYAMVSSLIPSVKYEQMRSLADPEKWSNTDDYGEKALKVQATLKYYKQTLLLTISHEGRDDPQLILSYEDTLVR